MLVTNDIGIEVVPIHTFDNIKKIYVPSNNHLQIRINVGNKRMIIPMFIVSDGILNFTKYNIDLKSLDDMPFSAIISTYPDIIEFMDIGQCLYSIIHNDYEVFIKLDINDKKKYDYVTFPPYLNFSYISSCLYDIGKITGVRGTFGDAQQKQVISGPVDDVFNKFDSCNFLAFPIERPCITNIPLEYSGIARNGIGYHILTGLCSWNMNIEDGIIINRELVESGKLSVITMIPVKAEVSDIQINRENPLPQNSNNDYSKITHTGLPAVGTVLVNKYGTKDALYKCLKSMFKDSDDSNYVFDQSEGYPYEYPAVVIRVKKDGTDIIRLYELLSAYRRLKIGDKITTRAAQKGTIAMIVDPHNMPYISTGERIGILINSTSIVGRKTLSMNIEAMLTELFGKIPSHNGNIRYIDYPTFTSATTTDIIEMITKKLKKKYTSLSDKEIDDIVTCKQYLYNPHTHTPIGIYDPETKEYTKTFVAPIMYCRLSQMAADKIAVRNKGRLDKLGQPPSGKKKGGGIKVGEMEVDVIATHGAVYTLHEMMSDSGDKQLLAKMCGNCGIFATYTSTKYYNRWHCLHCDNLQLSPKIFEVNLTYATKIFISILNARGISLIPIENKTQLYYGSNYN